MHFGFILKPTELKEEGGKKIALRSLINLPYGTEPVLLWQMDSKNLKRFIVARVEKQR